jgi:hypothetical protein
MVITLQAFGTFNDTCFQRCQRFVPCPCVLFVLTLTPFASCHVESLSPSHSPSALNTQHHTQCQLPKTFIVAPMLLQMPELSLINCHQLTLTCRWLSNASTQLLHMTPPLTP